MKKLFFPISIFVLALIFTNGCGAGGCEGGAPGGGTPGAPQAP